MLSLTFFNRSFTPKWSMTLLAFLVIALLMRLGFWQLARAEEKQQILKIQMESSTKASTLWQVKDKTPQPFQKIRVHGTYDHPIFYLDNQHHDHQIGYDILSPFKLSDGSLVLIDRGWISAGRDRNQLPQVQSPKDSQEIVGQAYYPSDKTWVLGEVLEKKNVNQVILEKFDRTLLQQTLQKKVQPFIIRLSPDEKNGFIREWQVVSMPPVRHTGYAVQWFAMAAAVFLIYVGLNLKKK